MNCVSVERELLAYHFNELAPALRDDLEAHLLGCPACVAAYIAQKRSVERPTPAVVPSARARLRLRSAVAAELDLTPRTRWQRTVAFAMAAAAVVFADATMRAITSVPGSPPHHAAHAGQPEGTDH